MAGHHRPRVPTRLVPGPRRTGSHPGAQLVFHATEQQAERLGLPADHTATGTVISVHPGRILEYMWDAEVLHWELVPDGSGAAG